jgi:hypothetical protein
MKTEALTVTCLDQVEIEASSPSVPDVQDDAPLPGGQRGKMRLPTLAGLLRGTGAMVIAVAFAIFTVQGLAGWRRAFPLPAAHGQHPGPDLCGFRERSLSARK